MGMAGSAGLEIRSRSLSPTFGKNQNGEERECDGGKRGERIKLALSSINSRNDDVFDENAKRPRAGSYQTRRPPPATAAPVARPARGQCHPAGQHCLLPASVGG